MKYTISFVGRKVGALGICYPMVETVEADSREDALTKLYERFEHIVIERVRETS